MQAEFAARYADLEVWHWWFRGRRAILGEVLRRELSRRASSGEVERIASLGCGPAESLGWIAGFVEPGGMVLGVDGDATGALRRRATSSAARLDSVRFVLGRLEELPVRKGAFDAVLALDVVEHLDDDAGALREAFELLVPGGLLMVTVPALPSLWGAQDIVAHHRRRYTRRTLAEAFGRAGLPPPRIDYFNTLLFLPIAAARWTRRWLGRVDAARSDFEANRPGLANELLASIFAAERRLAGRLPMPVGVSLLAIGRRPRGTPR